MLGTLKGAVLVCAVAITPLTAATVVWAPSTQAAAGAAGVCAGGKQVESAPLTANGVSWGTVYLCYNSTGARAWGVVTSSRLSCEESGLLGCASAIVEHKGGSDAKHCATPPEGSSCATGRIPDGVGDPSNASADECVRAAAPFVCEGYASGRTKNYP